MSDAKSGKKTTEATPPPMKAGDQIRALSSASVLANSGPLLVRATAPSFDVELWRVNAPGASRVSFTITLANGEQKTYEIADANGLHLAISKTKPTTQAVAAGAKKVAGTIGDAVKDAYRSMRDFLSSDTTSSETDTGTATVSRTKK